MNWHIPSESGIYYAGTGGIFIRSYLSRCQWLLALSAGILFSIIIYLFSQHSLSAISSRQGDYDRLIMSWHCTPGFLIYLFLCRCLPFCLLLILTLRTGKRFFFLLVLSIYRICLRGSKHFIRCRVSIFRAVIVLFPSGTPNLFLFAGTIPGLASCRQSGISFSFRQKTFISDKHVVMDRRNAVRMGT